MLINEYRLNLVDPEARKALERQMRAFLNVPATRPE
jgi:Fe-S cluster biosynthesis and repair protein YggX